MCWQGVYLLNDKFTTIPPPSGNTKSLPQDEVALKEFAVARDGYQIVACRL